MRVVEDLYSMAKGQFLWGNNILLEILMVRRSLSGRDQNHGKNHSVEGKQWIQRPCKGNSFEILEEEKEKQCG